MSKTISSTNSYRNFEVYFDFRFSGIAKTVNGSVFDLSDDLGTYLVEVRHILC